MSARSPPLTAHPEPPVPPADSHPVARAILERVGYTERLGSLSRVAAESTAPAVDGLVVLARDVLRTDPEEASERARLALSAATAMNDAPRMLASACVVADASLLIGRHSDALATAEGAIRRATTAGLPEMARRPAELTRIQSLVHLDRTDEAMTAAMSLRARCDRDGTVHERVGIRMVLADLAFRTDQPREALRLYREVVELLPPGVGPVYRGMVEANRANSLAAANRHHAALRGFARARALFAQAGNDHHVAQTEYNIAWVEASCGRYAEALARLTRVEERFRRLDDSRHLAHVALDRAEIHAQLRLGADARREALDARARFDALGLRKESATASMLAGEGAHLLGDAEAAYADTAAAAATFGAIGLFERRAITLARRARIAMSRRDLVGARRDLSDATTAVADGAGPLVVATVAVGRAALALESGDPADALREAERALESAGRALTRPIELDVRAVVARALAASGREDEAVEAYEHAIATLEAWRDGVPSDEFMTAFLAGHSALYVELVDLLARRGDVAAAFRYAERAKSRALAELLSTRRPAEDRPRIGDAETDRRVTYLRERLSSIYRRIAATRQSTGERGSRAAERAVADAARVEEELSTVLRDARMGPADHAAAIRSADEVRADLDADTTLIEYVLGPSALVVFVVSRDGFQAIRREIDPAAIRVPLERLRLQLARADAASAERPIDEGIEPIAQSLRELGEVLVGPIAPLIRTQRLVVVPHGALHRVPFHALPLGDGIVLDRHAVSYAPSATVHSLCRRTTTPDLGPGAVLGIPDDEAPRIGDEAQRVAALLGTPTVHIGPDATFDRLRDACRDSRVVHVATHGMFRRENPSLSSIRLADRWVNLYDVYDLDVRADLVVLATCESGVADVSAGDEIVGLARGFLRAGAPSIVTTQWRVDDDATASWMGEFYGELARGADAAQAHRLATLAIRASRPHPYHWAGFFVIGRGPRPASAAASRDAAPVPAHRIRALVETAA